MDYTQYKQLHFRRRFLRIVGAKVDITDASGQVPLGMLQEKFATLHDHMTLYRDDSKTQPLLIIRARQAVAFNRTFDIVDAQSGQLLFVLQRRGLKSAFVRDHWYLLTAQDQQFGEVIETSSTLAIVRRYVSAINDWLALILAFVPETYTIQTTGDGRQIIGKTVHTKNPFVVNIDLDTSMSQIAIDPRVAIAASLLLCIKDATKNN